MRRGIQWNERPPMGGIQYLMPGETFLGVPLVYRPKVGMAQAIGLFRWKRIAVGDMWFNLDRHQQQAVLLHEYAHCKMFHMEQRLLVVPMFWTAWARSRAREHEFAADLFAAKRGYGLEFVQFLRKYGTKSEFHPDPDERAARILRVVMEKLYELQAA